MQTHLIEVQQTARYYVLGEDLAQPSDVWLCLHGYGLIGERFAPKFEPWVAKGARVIAPEGFQRFYLMDDWNKVGCNWMTRDLREHDIVNINTYLSRVLDIATQDLIPNSYRLHVLGFSQGAPVAWRFVNFTHHKVQTLVLYAGTFPDEPLRPWQLQDLKILLPMGDSDQYLIPERMAAHAELVAKQGLQIENIPFRGGHVILPEVLDQVWEKACGPLVTP